MKVLQINSVCGIGSTGRIATDINNIIIDKGYESYIAYGRDLPMNCVSPIKIGTKIDNYRHVLLTRIFDKHGFGSKRATKEFIVEIERINPDVIHLHNIHGYYINIEILFEYLRKANKAVVWTLHDCWSFTGHCSHFDYVGCNKWKLGCYECPQKKEYPKSSLIDNSKYNFLKKQESFTDIPNLIIVTPSKWLANLVNESFLNEYPIKVTNNGIDLELFKPTESNFRKRHNLEDKFIVLGVASTWQKRKGYKYFLDLSGMLTSDEVIVLVGLTEKQLVQLPKNIIGITRTNNISELAEIYSEADVYINTTLEEVLGMTNIEALACGTPVITFNTGGSPECIDENCGIVVEKENLDELIKGIKKIKVDGKQNYAEQCIVRAKSLYDKNDRFNDYINLYKEILV